MVRAFGVDHDTSPNNFRTLTAGDITVERIIASTVISAYSTADLNVDDDVTIGGMTVLSSTADGDGIWISSDATILDDAEITGALSVGESLTAASISSTGSLTADAISANSDITVDGAISASGDVTAASGVLVEGLDVGSGRVMMPGGTNDNGIAFGSLGTATRGIDFTNSNLAGTGDYLVYGGATWGIRSDGAFVADNEGFLITSVCNLDSQTTPTHVRLRSNLYPLTIESRNDREIILDVTGTNESVVIGNKTYVGEIADASSNGTTTIAKTSHGLTLTAGMMVHVYDATTTADEGYYRLVSSTADTLVVDRALTGSDSDLYIYVWEDVIGFFATDGTNGQRIMNYSAQDKPLQIGGDELVATTGFGSEDVMIGNNLGISGTLSAGGNLTAASLTADAISANSDVTVAGNISASGNLSGDLMHVEGDHIKIATSLTVSAANAPGTAGMICWDGGFVYVCTADNSWERAAIAAW